MLVLTRLFFPFSLLGGGKSPACLASHHALACTNTTLIFLFLTIPRALWRFDVLVDSVWVEQPPWTLSPSSQDCTSGQLRQEPGSPHLSRDPTAAANLSH